MGVRSYWDLAVWQKAMDLVVDCYELTRQFPTDELYGLTSQARRAAISIPSNIAEGRARESTKEFLKHLGIASGSLAELESQIEIARRLAYIADAQAVALASRLEEIGRMLTGLRASLKRKLR